MHILSSIFKFFSKFKPQELGKEKNTDKPNPVLDARLLESKLDEGWRQGTVLSVESSQLLGEFGEGGSGVLVVISQTCDLLHHSLEKEPTVDLLYGELREGSAPKSAGKSFREFELELNTHNGSKHLYVTARPRLEICRYSLFEHGRKHDFQPNSRSLIWFSRWLGEKYSRPAFPDAFDRKIAQQKGTKDKIANAVKNLSSCRGMYLALSSWKELDPAETYSVSVLLLLQCKASADEQDAAQNAHTKICGLLESAGHDVVHEESAVKLDSDVTIRDFDYLRKWSLDYISIRNPDHEEPPTIA